MKNIDDFGILGEPVLTVLGKHNFSVNFDVKDSGTALDQRGINAKLTSQIGRQTGGLGQIVSLTAISDRYIHANFPLQKTDSLVAGKHTNGGARPRTTTRVAA